MCHLLGNEVKGMQRLLMIILVHLLEEKSGLGYGDMASKPSKLMFGRAVRSGTSHTLPSHRLIRAGVTAAAKQFL